jgi:hypothetical protein
MTIFGNSPFLGGVGMNRATVSPPPPPPPGDAYHDAVMADSPLGYYRLNESSGSVATDSSGNGRNGAYSGSGVTLAQTGLLYGNSDKSVFFGSNGDVSESTLKTALGGASAATIEFIIKRALNSDRCVISFGTVNGNRFGFFVETDTTAYLLCENPVANTYAVLQMPYGMTAGKQHVVMVFDGTQATANDRIKIYVNRLLRTPSSYFGTFPATLAASANLSNFSIGHDQVNTGEYSNCYIDEVAVYGSALSLARIQAHFDAAWAPLNSGAITSRPQSDLRNDFTGRVGCKFTANANMTVTHLGLWKVPGNVSVSTIYLDAAGGGNLASASVDQSASGSDGDATYQYAALSSPVSLISGSTYYIGLSTVLNDGSYWSNEDATVVSTGDISIIRSAYFTSNWNDASAGMSYGFPNFKYTIP